MPIKSQPSNRVLLVGFVLALLLILGVSAFSFWNTLQLVENAALVAHTNDVIARLNSLMANMTDAETGQRGYLLTGEVWHLEPYNTALSTIHSQFDNLRQLTADNPVQQQSLQTLSPLIDARLNLLKQNIDVRGQNPSDTTDLVARVDEGKRTHDQIRNIVAEMVAEEQRLLTPRTAESVISARNILITLAVGTLASFLILVSIFYFLNREIGQRRRAETALKDSEQRFRGVFEQTFQFMALLDPKGTVLEANQAALNLAGLEANQVRKRPFWEVPIWAGAAETRDNLKAAISQAAAGEFVRYEADIWNSASARSTVDFSLKPIKDEQSQVALLIAEGRDLSARKQAERVLRDAHDQLERRVQERTEDLQVANEELSTFTYIVSHDLRAPLVNLKGFSAEIRDSIAIIRETLQNAPLTLDETAKTALDRAIQEDLPEALTFIESSVTRMDHLTNAVLRLSRLGRRELSTETVNMNALVETITNSLAHQIKERQAEVHVADLPPVTADRVSMEQIMGNILTNAVLYLDPTRPSQISVTAEKTAAATTFHIQDNGRGIAQEDQHKVFEPFRRAGKANVQGEGMGLAYVQALVRRHGGRIWYTSQAGVGTTFSFTIPNVITGNNKHG